MINVFCSIIKCNTQIECINVVIYLTKSSVYGGDKYYQPNNEIIVNNLSNATVRYYSYSHYNSVHCLFIWRILIFGRLPVTRKLISHGSLHRQTLNIHGKFHWKQNNLMNRAHTGSIRKL